jgi:hypothetical protein
MKMSRIGSSVLLAAMLASPFAFAQTAPPDPLQPGAAALTEAQDAAAAKKPAASVKAASRRAAHTAAPGMLTVTIYNKRSVGLVELHVGPTGGELKKVQGALAFGRKSTVHVPRAKECLYDIKGHYADEADTEQTGVDLCKDKTIYLTDE